MKKMTGFSPKFLVSTQYAINNQPKESRGAKMQKRTKYGILYGESV